MKSCLYNNVMSKRNISSNWIYKRNDFLDSKVDSSYYFKAQYFVCFDISNEIEKLFCDRSLFKYSGVDTLSC